MEAQAGSVVGPFPIPTDASVTLDASMTGSFVLVRPKGEEDEAVDDDEEDDAFMDEEQQDLDMELIEKGLQNIEVASSSRSRSSTSSSLLVQACGGGMPRARSWRVSRTTGRTIGCFMTCAAWRF